MGNPERDDDWMEKGFLALLPGKKSSKIIIILTERMKWSILCSSIFTMLTHTHPSVLFVYLSMNLCVCVCVERASYLTLMMMKKTNPIFVMNGGRRTRMRMRGMMEDEDEDGDEAS